MTGWRQLVDAIVRGVDSVEVLSHVQEPTLAALLRTARIHAPEHATLAAAGALWLYRAVGSQPATLTLPHVDLRRAGHGAIEPAGAASLPTVSRPGADTVDQARKAETCDAATAKLLESLLFHGHTQLVTELLVRLHAHGMAVPALFIPDLLARFANAATLRPTLAAVIGAVGRQLAAENPAWHPLSAQAESWDGLMALWQVSDMRARRHLIAQTRAADPTLGRSLLEVHWRQLGSKRREPLIQALERGLSMDDEPFLETVLDDREYSVRRRAAELLARLTDSRLAARMADAAAAYLAWTPDEDAAIAVRPPDTIPPVLQRDGVHNHTRGNRVRWQGAQLSYVVGCVPLSHWEEMWQSTPETIVSAALAGRWPRTLTTGFAHAAMAQHNHAWAAVLLPACDFGHHVLRAVPVLQPGQLDALIQGHVAVDGPLDNDALLVTLVRRWPHVWTDTLTAVWVDAVAVTLEAAAPGGRLDRGVVTAIRDFALRADPCWHAAAVRRWMPQLNTDARTKTAVCEALALLDLRAQMVDLLPDPVSAA